MTHSELKEKALKREKVQVAYEASVPEFSLIRELLKVRQKMGLNQTEIRRMDHEFRT